MEPASVQPAAARPAGTEDPALRAALERASTVDANNVVALLEAQARLAEALADALARVSGADKVLANAFLLRTQVGPRMLVRDAMQLAALHSTLRAELNSPPLWEAFLARDYDLSPEQRAALDAQLRTLRRAPRTKTRVEGVPLTVAAYEGAIEHVHPKLCYEYLYRNERAMHAIDPVAVYGDDFYGDRSPFYSPRDNLVTVLVNGYAIALTQLDNDRPSDTQSAVRMWAPSAADSPQPEWRVVKAYGKQSQRRLIAPEAGFVSTLAASKRTGDVAIVLFNRGQPTTTTTTTTAGQVNTPSHSTIYFSTAEQLSQDGYAINLDTPTWTRHKLEFQVPMFYVTFIGPRFATVRDYASHRLAIFEKRPSATFDGHGVWAAPTYVQMPPNIGSITISLDDETLVFLPELHNQNAVDGIVVCKLAETRLVSGGALAVQRHAVPKRDYYRATAVWPHYVVLIYLKESARSFAALICDVRTGRYDKITIGGSSDLESVVALGPSRFIVYRTLRRVLVERSTIEGASTEWKTTLFDDARLGGLSSPKDVTWDLRYAKNGFDRLYDVAAAEYMREGLLSCEACAGPAQFREATAAGTALCSRACQRAHHNAQKKGHEVDFIRADMQLAGWRCASCRADNARGAFACARCGTPKNALPGPAPLPASDWRCAHCNTSNRADRGICYHCYRARGAPLGV